MLLHGSKQFASAAFGAKPDFRRVVLSLQSQLSLAGIHPRGLRQVEHHLHLIERASFGEQAAGKLQSSQR